MPRQWIRDHDYDFLDPEFYGRDVDEDPDAIRLQDARDATAPCDEYDPDDREPMGGDPYWRERDHDR